MITRSTCWAAILGCYAMTAWGARPPTVRTDAPLAPLEAARTMKVPEGFHVTLFAGEPDVKQPIGFCIDDRGRLWVAEAYNYPNHGLRPGDRILIFEDVDGDGRFDKRTIFYDGLNYVTGIEVGFGGAWVMSPPNFYFIPDRNGDDKPDGEPIVLLDGFGNHANSHNLANGLAWGPDGWLYGTHGRTNWSTIGKPGTPDAQRGRFDGGVYRYHPVRHVWEPFADGTTNPWGIDWNDYGEAFVCNCVNPHLFHVIQGAHYEPWRNRESSRYAYQRIDTIADHVHYVGKGSVVEGLGSAEEDAAGGGHAHCGTMLYLGDQWPNAYRNNVFMHNIHGRRINNDILSRVGSGYVASHGKDLMRAQDLWYMGVTLCYGPDGAVYSSDWSDTGECHSVVNTQRETGRIFKITYGQSKVTPVDLARLSNMELVVLQSHRNDWHVRHARRILQERASQGIALSDVVVELQKLLAATPAADRKLRFLWALHAIGRADDNLLLSLLSDESEYVRGWAVRLLTENPLSARAVRDRFTDLAKTDPSALVCRHLASALLRLSAVDRWPIAEALLVRSEFSDDANIPLMLWYGVEPLVHDDLSRFVKLSTQASFPLVRRFIARRVAEMTGDRTALTLLVGSVAECPTDNCRDLLAGIFKGLEGQRNALMPDTWSATYAKLRQSPDASVRDSALRLALVFSDPVAIRTLLEQATDPSATADARNRAIEALVAKKVDGFDRQLLALVRQSATRGAALRGLAAYNHPDTTSAIFAVYSNIDAATRQDALHTLASRATWALALLDAVEAGRIPRADVTAFTARQIHSLGDDQLAGRVYKLWGRIREIPVEKTRLIGSYKQRFTPAALHAGDRNAGRAIFEKQCANCHRLFGDGSAIGPDLTGSQRTNIDYLLLNIVDPSASISKDFQMEVIETTDGRVVTGMIVAETASAITVQTTNEKIVIPTSELERRVQSNVSMMPEGLLAGFKPAEVHDLFAYLVGSGQPASNNSSPPTVEPTR